MGRLLPLLPSTRFDMSTLQRIGQGAGGYVWSVRDHRLREDVAVKTLKFDGELTQRNVDMFVWEYTLASSVENHPHVVRIHESSPTPEPGQDGFIAMELVGQDTLAHQIDVHGALPLDRVAAVGAAIADALDGTHEAGVLHRDVKPENILVGPRGEVKLTDFGYAMLAYGDERRPSIAGTPGYMPPEMAREFVAKQLGRPSPRAPVNTQEGDLYGLGVILYELTAGRHVFPGTRDERLFAQLAGDAEPIAKAVDGVPPRLSRLITALMADNPGSRPGYANEVRDELADLATTLPHERVGQAGVVKEPSTLAELPVAMPSSSRSTGRESEASALEKQASRVAAAGVVPLSSLRQAGPKADPSPSRPRSARDVSVSHQLPKAGPSAPERGNAGPRSDQHPSTGDDYSGKTQEHGL